MDLGPHAAFIVSAYVIATLVVAALAVWIIVDHRQQLRRLADLESRGVTRRSERGPSLPRSGGPAPGPIGG
jgi:heme exporter protein D